jgi:hypothetical protein
MAAIAPARVVHIVVDLVDTGAIPREHYISHPKAIRNLGPVLIELVQDMADNNDIKLKATTRVNVELTVCWMDVSDPQMVCGVLNGAYPYHELVAEEAPVLKGTYPKSKLSGLAMPV